MTETEVEAILGRPVRYNWSASYADSGDFVSPLEIFAFSTKHRGIPIREQTCKIKLKVWFGNTWGICVVFDENGRVIHSVLMAFRCPVPRGQMTWRKFVWHLGNLGP